MLRETYGEGTDMYDEQLLETWAPASDWTESPPAPVAMPETVRRCRQIAEAIGATGFSLLFTAAQGERNRLAPVFDSAFPGVSSLSRALSSRLADGFARKAAQAAAPLWWRAPGAPFFLSADARLWASETASPLAGAPMADSCGIAFPVGQENGRVGLVVFCGDGLVLDEQALCATHAHCHALFAEVARQRPLAGAAPPAMSKREIECLRLTANGFTSDEIAAELGLSVHTANQYLASSSHKLNAVNRIHAVAKALRAGLID